MSARLTLRIPNRIEELPAVSDAVETLGREEDWAADVAFAVVLALEEVAANVVRHGGVEEGSGEIEIEVVSTDAEARVEVRDGGMPFDPFHDAPEPDLDTTLEDRQIGGLGLHLVRSLIDEARYRREDGRNHIMMLKRRG